MQSIIVSLLIATLLAFAEPVFAGSAIVSPNLKSNKIETSAKITKVPSGKVLALHQSSLILGDFDVLIGASGIKASCKRSGITFVSRPPAWNPVGYSTFSRSVWRPNRTNFSPINDMCKSLPMLGLPNTWTIPVVRTGQKDVSGFTCESFSTTQAWTKEQVKQYNQGLMQRTSPRSADYNAANLGLPGAACQILEHIYGVPSCSLLPVHFTYEKMRHTIGIGLKTKSYLIVIPPKNWLDVPAEYKTVKTFNELNMDKGAQAGAEDLFGH